MAMNSQQIRVVDRVITNIIWGVASAKNLVGSILFPYVNITRLDSKVIKFGMEDFELIDSHRTPGSDFKSVEVEYGDETVHFIQDALSAKIPIESIQASVGLNIDLKAIAVKKVLKKQHRKLEKEHADLATNPSNYSSKHVKNLTGTERFSDFENSKPDEIAEEARETIRDSVGTYPNVGVISAKAFRWVKRHPIYKEQFKYTTNKTMTVDMLRDAWELDKLAVGEEIWSENGQRKDMWGKNIILAYVSPDTIEQQVKPDTPTDEEQPSFGYTYREAGSPLAEEFYFDKNSASWKSNIIYNRKAYIVGEDAAFLITDAVD